MTVPITVLIGTATFSGSAVAYFKLSGKKMVHPVKGTTKHYVHGALLLAAILFGIWLVTTGGVAGGVIAAILLVAVSFGLGWLLTLPIGGADMPVVVALLNSYSGLAAAASGFIILNPLRIDVESDYAAVTSEGHGHRQTDVAESDNGNSSTVRHQFTR